MTTPIVPPEEFERLVKKYINLLGLGHPWRFDVTVRTKESDPLVDEEDTAAYASCRCLPEYFRASFYFDAIHPSWEIVEGGDVEKCVRHEVMHIPLGIIACLARDMLEGNEAACTALTYAEERAATIFEFAPFWDTPAPTP